MIDDKIETYNILLIEDDPNIASHLKSAFEVRNHKLRVINDGSVALVELEKLEKNSFHAVLLDLMLPGANGWEILAKIRSLPNTQNTPVIMLTGIDDSSSEARALYDGADDYVTKPFTFKVLIARIEANVRKRKETPIDTLELPFEKDDIEPLSERETEILSYIVKGFSSKEIGETLYISENTVMNHVKKILKKLKVENRMQAAILALKNNLV